MNKLDFSDDGATVFRASLAREQLRVVEAALSDLPCYRAGIRLQGIDDLARAFEAAEPAARCAASVLGPDCRPVRAILFDKTPARNWSLAWHQDRTVAVKERIEVAGFGPWSVKNGMPHVEPPIALLARMATLRIHMDAVPATNAPLLIARGSHRLGRIAASEVAEVVRRCGTIACLAEPGDVWVYATAILHASEAAATPSRRRVLQVDFAVEELPGGLEWLGI